MHAKYKITARHRVGKMVKQCEDSVRTSSNSNAGSWNGASFWFEVS
jgi:hypothetical protein